MPTQKGISILKMSDTQYDKLLKIHTTGRDDSHSDTFRYPYEPTPYEVREELMFVDEISCEDLFPGDSRERILVFEMG